MLAAPFQCLFVQIDTCIQDRPLELDLAVEVWTSSCIDLYTEPHLALHISFTESLIRKNKTPAQRHPQTQWPRRTEAAACNSLKLSWLTPRIIWRCKANPENSLPPRDN